MEQDLMALLLFVSRSNPATAFPVNAPITSVTGASTEDARRRSRFSPSSSAFTAGGAARKAPRQVLEDFRAVLPFTKYCFYWVVEYRLPERPGFIRNRQDLQSLPREFG
jgi:hypothetical protein